MKTWGKSFWLDYPYKPREALKEDVETDVIIVGGGITGASAAYHLSKNDIDFVLLEKNLIGSESTGRSAGSLVPGTESDFFEAVEKFGARKALFLWKSMIDAIRNIRREIKSSKIVCDFSETNAFYLARKKDDLRILEREHKETNRCGLPTTLLDRKNLKESVSVGNKFYGALRYDYGSAVVNPAKLARGLVSKIKKDRIFEKTGVKKIEHKDGIFMVSTDAGTAKSKKLILATEAFTNSLGIIGNRINSIKVRAIVTEKISKGLMEEIKFSYKNLIWDTGVLYNFIRMTKDNRILITGRDVEASDNYSINGKDVENLRRQLMEFFPQLENVNIEYGWSGSIGFTSHRLPMIGQDTRNKNLLYSLGYGGHGMTLGFLGGKMLGEICSNTLSTDTKRLLEIFKPVEKSKIMTALESFLIGPYISMLKLGN